MFHPITTPSAVLAYDHLCFFQPVVAVLSTPSRLRGLRAKAHLRRRQQAQDGGGTQGATAREAEVLRELEKVDLDPSRHEHILDDEKICPDLACSSMMIDILDQCRLFSV